MKPLYIDLECVTRDDARERLVAGVRPSKAITKAETLEKWEATERPAAEDKAFRDGALSALYGQILCIGDADADSDPFVWYQQDTYGESHGEDDERELLQRWVTCSICHDERPLSKQEPRLLVGHNIAAFDLPYIFQRCRILGVELPWWWPAPNTPEWKCDNVFDTMTYWCGTRRSYVSLKDLCWAFGIQCTDEIDGSQVHDAYRNGEIDKIVEHCRSDVAAVRELHRRLIN